MSIESAVANTADYVASQSDQKAARLHDQYQKVKLEAEKLLAERNLARRALQRRADFVVKVGADYQCPRCWIEREKRSPLRPLEGDIMACRECGIDIQVD
ncbi:hypothetical protein [Lichenifustis flavocetrariae]|uniref:Uncharacterized protein n=1 Tax=Lichenifustis flavocetrariae TaxID=2949735 RepID=A0AA41Z225_9HYPH|nr:hypothetical protein [Lichenifustis flavocetrariae]MCW6511400.1 hypothetical protein [Lichenifustis flavocetrariae]